MQRRLIVLAACFGLSWLVWLIIGFTSYDPFDDDLLPWLWFVTLMLGTPCGVVLAVIGLAVLEIWWQRRDGAS